MKEGFNVATTLLKLIMNTPQSINTAIPTVLRYFHTVPSGGYTGAATYTIKDEYWVNSAGAAVAEHGLTPATARNEYYLLYINGMLQKGNVVTSVTTDDVTITFGAATTIEEGKIITLAVTNFAVSTAVPTVTG